MAGMGEMQRVDVPKSAVVHFSQPEVRISVECAARILGFAHVEQLRKFAAPLLKQFDGAEPLGVHLGALTFNRLVVLCAAKTAAARKLLEELASTWTYCSGKGGDTVVNLPAEPAGAAGGSSSGALRWPSCLPEAVGMDKAPLDRLRQYLQWRINMRHFAGIACGIVRNGQMVYYQESGYADAETKMKMTGDTIVRLFSMTKCLVSAAFMTFVEDPSNNIDLDDYVSKYIPAFDVQKMEVLAKRGQKENQPLEKPITLRQLLTHTSGIGYGATLDDPWPPEKGSYYKIYEELAESTRDGTISSLEEWCNALARCPLKGQPGRYWDYSYSLDVIGRVCEVVAGRPLDAVMEERICGPLKMRDTGFIIPPEKAARIGPWYKSVEIEGKSNLAHRLEVVDRGGENSGWVSQNASKIFSGGGTVEVPLASKGGMVSTFNDYLRFLLMLRNFGELDGVRVLKRETVQMMMCNHIPVACYGKKSVFVFDKPGVGYSCLGQIQGQHPKQDRGTYSGEYGWGGLAGPAWTIDPRADLIVLSVTQTAFVLDHEEYLRYAARRAIHQHIFGSVAGPAKATSYSPECFDIVRPKQAQEPSSTEEQVSMDKEFFEEHSAYSKMRVWGAKERAINPGPRLDRHPSEDEESCDGEVVVDGAAKRRRTTGPITPAPSLATASPTGAKSPAPLNQVFSVPSPGKPTARAAAAQNAQQEDRHELLFSRVCLQGDVSEDVKKARVTAVEGKKVEVITEGNFTTMNVNIGDVSVIDESHIGVSTVSDGGPTDFGFLMADSNQSSHVALTPEPKIRSPPKAK